MTETDFHQQPIRALAQQLAEHPLPIPEALLTELARDARRGVQRLATQYRRKNAIFYKEQALIMRLKQRERELHAQGYRYIAGVDEVGRGPLAGPVVVAAVILPSDMPPIYLNDSKQVPQARRQAIVTALERYAVAISVASIDNETIDRLNILEATRLGMRQAIDGLAVTPDYVITDAVAVPGLVMPAEHPNHADATVYSVAAASIYAKEYRDRVMRDYARQYPAYHFEENVGYPTPAHLAALKRYGLTSIHRKSFQPVHELLNDA